MRPVSLAPSHAPGTAPDEPRREQVPFDLEAKRMRGEAGDAEEEPDDEVRADRAPCVQPDRPQQRGHPQGAEDDPERPADEADHEAEDSGGVQARLDGAGLARNGVTSRSTPFQARTAAMPAKSARVGTRRPVSAPTTAPITEVGSHPRDHAPVHASLTRVPEPAGGRRGCARSRCSSRQPRSRHPQREHRRQPQRAEHEAHRRAEVPRDERRREYQQYSESFDPRVPEAPLTVRGKPAARWTVN